MGLKRKNLKLNKNFLTFLELTKFKPKTKYKSIKNKIRSWERESFLNPFFTKDFQTVNDVNWFYYFYRTPHIPKKRKRKRNRLKWFKFSKKKYIPFAFKNNNFYILKEFSVKKNYYRLADKKKKNKKKKKGFFSLNGSRLFNRFFFRHLGFSRCFNESKNQIFDDNNLFMCSRWKYNSFLWIICKYAKNKHFVGGKKLVGVSKHAQYEKWCKYLGILKQWSRYHFNSVFLNRSKNYYLSSLFNAYQFSSLRTFHYGLQLFKLGLCNLLVGFSVVSLFYIWKFYFLRKGFSSLTRNSFYKFLLSLNFTKTNMYKTFGLKFKNYKYKNIVKRKWRPGRMKIYSNLFYSIKKKMILFHKLRSQKVAELKYYMLGKELKYQIFSNTNQMVNLFIMPFHLLHKSASIVGIFVATRLQQNYKLSRVMRIVIRTLLVCKEIKGIVIKCAGRFTRQQRAKRITVFADTRRFRPLSTFTSLIDYSFKLAYLKNGSCGIKVWLLWDDAFLTSMYFRGRRFDVRRLSKLLSYKDNFSFVTNSWIYRKNSKKFRNIHVKKRKNKLKNRKFINNKFLFYLKKKKKFLLRFCNIYKMKIKTFKSLIYYKPKLKFSANFSKELKNNVLWHSLFKLKFKRKFKSKFKSIYNKELKLKQKLYIRPSYRRFSLFKSSKIFERLKYYNFVKSKYDLKFSSYKYNQIFDKKFAKFMKNISLDKIREKLIKIMYWKKKKLRVNWFVLYPKNYLWEPKDLINIIPC